MLCAQIQHNQTLIFGGIDLKHEINPYCWHFKHDGDFDKVMNK